MTLSATLPSHRRGRPPPPCVWRAIRQSPWLPASSRMAVAGVVMADHVGGNAQVLAAQAVGDSIEMDLGFVTLLLPAALVDDMERAAEGIVTQVENRLDHAQKRVIGAQQLPHG